MVPNGDDQLDSSEVDCPFVYMGVCYTWTPKVAYNDVFFFLYFLWLVGQKTRGHNHGLIIYAAMVGGNFSLQLRRDVSKFQIVRMIEGMRDLPREIGIFPIQHDDMIWYDTIRYAMIWYDMIWYDIWYDMIWYDMIWYDMIWYDMIWYDMIWYDMICEHPTKRI